MVGLFPEHPPDPSFCLCTAGSYKEPLVPPGNGQGMHRRMADRAQDEDRGDGIPIDHTGDTVDLKETGSYPVPTAFTALIGRHFEHARLLRRQ